MTFERIEEITKHHALDGRFRGCRIHMSEALSARLMQRYQPPEGEQEIDKLRNIMFGAPLLYQLMGIPIINDVGMDDECQWILVDATGEVIERGEVDADTSQDSPERKTSGAATE